MGRPDEIGSVLLDASALLGLVTDDPEFRCLRSLMEAVDRGEIRLVESTAILAEVLVQHKKDTVEHALARTSLRVLLESPTTQLVDVSTAVARKAGDLKVQQGMNTWDAVHLATAIIAGVDVVIVRDRVWPEGDVEGVYVTGPFDIDEDKLPLG